MTESNSSRPAKPDKPTPDFPLTAHPAGYWCKKIRGKLHYFGPWSDPDGALAKYNEQKEALHAGKRPREPAEATGGTTVKAVVNAFLNAKQALLESGELSPRTWLDYKEACDTIILAFGKGRLASDLDGDDFAALRKSMAARWGPHRLGNVIQSVRTVFKYAYDAGLLDRPLRYGPDFGRPSKRVLRINKAEQGPRLFTAGEIRAMIGAAAVPLRAMILLATNCGFGNSDCGKLPKTALDLEGGWANFPRPKTGIPRRCPLWPETVAALREAIDRRPAPNDPSHEGLVFITPGGFSYHRDTQDNPVGAATARLMKRLGIANGRKGRGFYTMRHVHRTVSDGAKDQPAADLIMGHLVASMSAVYRETIDDARLRAVTDHVRAWLFPTTPAAR
jgi:integrase